MARLIAIAAVIALVFSFVGSYLAISYKEHAYFRDLSSLFGDTRNGDVDRFAECRGGQVAGGGDIGGPFELVNAAGETVTEAEVIDGPTLVYFGYTFCPDVCPLDTVRNADAVDLLAERGFDVTPVFITVDPQRDTPEAVGEFASNISERMVGLTGSAAQIAQAAQAYKAFYKAHPGDDDYYLVDHSTFTYLMTPGEGFLDFFRRDASAEEVAARTACFLEKMPN